MQTTATAEASTFPRLLLKHATERPGAPAMREKEYGIWQTRSWADLAVLVEHLACGLHQAGLQRGEHMIVVGARRRWCRGRSGVNTGSKTSTGKSRGGVTPKLSS